MCLAQQSGVKLPSVGSAGDDALFDDDYIEMDPVYTEPPLEDDDLNEQDGTLKANSSKCPLCCNYYRAMYEEVSIRTSCCYLTGKFLCV